MTTGKIEYSPDYKSKKPRLPKDFGLMKIACADGKHRFVPDAPKCGCGEIGNPEVERARLEREVIEAAKAELTVWEGFHTQGWTAASASARNKLRNATRALLAFEANQKGTDVTIPLTGVEAKTSIGNLGAIRSYDSEHDEEV